MPALFHDGVEAPEVLLGHTEHRLHGSGIPNIARNGDCSATTLLDLPDYPLGAVPA